jgi:hypothetical protein
MKTIIKTCSCVHASQDDIYGKGRRVMNPRTNGTVRCTVCGKDYQGESSERKEKKK